MIEIQTVRSLASAVELPLSEERIPLVAEELANVIAETAAWRELPLETVDPELLFVGSWE